MIVFPNVKINLGLSITEKRPDGFHNIESVFYPVPFCDVLEIQESDDLQFSSSGIEIPGNSSDNLCLKAYKLLKKDYPLLPNVHIHLHKVVPIGAGLGGGSSDAAFTLKALNEKFNLGASVEHLQDYCRKLGSDCAFFIENTPKYCFNKGDEFENFELDLSSYVFVIIYPHIHISTPVAYAGVKPSKKELNCKQVLTSDISNWKDLLKNDFEDSIFPKYSKISDIKNYLYEKGAVYASMSGSGSSVFGIFKEKPIDIYYPDSFLWMSEQKN